MTTTRQATPDAPDASGEQEAAEAAERHSLGPGPRPTRPPRPVVASWALGLAAGAALIGITGAHHLGNTASSRTVGLAPSTVAGYLQAAAGPDAQDVRISGFAFRRP